MSRMDARDKTNIEATEKNGIVGKMKASPQKTVRIIIIIILSLCLIAAGVTSWYVNSKLDKIESLTEEPEKWEDYELSCVDVDGYINILVLGVDARDMDNMDEWRSDAIMIISIKEETGEATVTSIYRDTFLYMAGQDFYDKITHAFYYDGVKESIKSINKCLDLNIRNYIIFNFNSAADVIDAMGGIDIEVEEYEIKELNRANRETWKLTGRRDKGDPIQIEEPGTHHVDGSMAVAYGRIRKGVGDDYKRTERMRIIVDKLLEKAKTLNLSQLNEVVNIGVSQIKTNLSKTDILGLASKLVGFKIVDSSSFPYSIDDGYVGQVSYVFPVDLYQDVKQLHENYFGQENYEPSEDVISISERIKQYKGGTGAAPSGGSSGTANEGYGGTSSWSPSYLPPSDTGSTSQGSSSPAPQQESSSESSSETTEPSTENTETETETTEPEEPAQEQTPQEPEESTPPPTQEESPPVVDSGGGESSGGDSGSNSNSGGDSVETGSSSSDSGGETAESDGGE